MLLLKFLVKTEIGQRSSCMYKMQDMYTNTNEGIVFEILSLVAA